LGIFPPVRRPAHSSGGFELIVALFAGNSARRDPVQRRLLILRVLPGLGRFVRSGFLSLFGRGSGFRFVFARFDLLCFRLGGIPIRFLQGRQRQGEDQTRCAHAAKEFSQSRFIQAPPGSDKKTFKEYISSPRNKWATRVIHVAYNSREGGNRVVDLRPSGERI
jgi:hypothetical protein